MGGPAGPAAAGQRGGRPRRRFMQHRRKVCQFCVEKTDVIDYKDAAKLRRFLSERGKIEPRRKFGTCAKHQRTLTQALKRARHIALLPFTGAHMREPGPYVPRG
ncbi:MAG TPA: 30S ribosomal protein S18 [Dehalococcoidia bacterium]|nr:30S ribosomal protein S18 [Dehalococcoidia bacterium]